MLPITVRESLQKQLDSIASSSAKPTLVVLDPYMAQALAGQLGPHYKVQDLFTWASETLAARKPNPIDLLEVFDESLKENKIKLLEESLPFRWRLAQLFAQDWQEVLLSTSSLEEALKRWEELAEHQHIQSLFPLQSDPPPWLKLIPLPLKSADTLKAFWVRFKDFLQTYVETLKKKGFEFSEGALQKLIPENRFEGVLFLHVYSVYPLLEKLLKTASHKVGWDITPLNQALPEAWADYTPLSETYPFPAQKPRKVYLHTSFVLTALIKSAAQQIATWVKAAPEGACAAVWCHPASEPLLRHFLKQEGLAPEQLSPQAPTLWEGTEIGKFLRPCLREGLEGRLYTWPEPPPLSAEEAPSAAESWARHLYQIVCRGEAHNPLHWNFLVQLFQEKAPTLPPFPGSVRLYIGQLTQLTGGCYDALFLVDPPLEPLGPWARPSFWIASLRKQFYSPAQHNRLAWRLQSVLLWASQEVWIFRLADPTRVPPIEELLVHREALGLKEEFAAVQSELPSVKASVPVPRPIEEPPQGAPKVSLSPSRVSSLFRCPRRFYWESALPEEGPPKEALSIGRLMHELVRYIVAGKASSCSPVETRWTRPPNGTKSRKASSCSPVETTLAKLAYRASRRRLLYRAARLLTPAERRLLGRTHSYRILMPILAEMGQPLMQALVELLQPGLHQKPRSGPPWRWHHFRPLATHRYQFYVEFCLEQLRPSSSRTPLPSLAGRLDLLIEAPSATSSPERFLLDFKQRLPRETQPTKVLEGLLETLQALQDKEAFTPPQHYDEALFQVMSYAWYLNQIGQSVTKIGLVSLWWRPQRKTPSPSKNSHEGPLLSFSLDPCEEKYLRSLWEEISSLLAARPLEPAEFPQTPDKESCRYCDFALLCDRLRV